MTPEPTPRPGWIASKKRKELRGVHEGSVLGAVFYLPIFERVQSREAVVALFGQKEGSLQGTYLHIAIQESRFQKPTKKTCDNKGNCSEG